MTFLFRTLWVINILLLLLVAAGKEFRSSFGAGVDLNLIIIIVILLVLVASVALRFSGKLKWISLVVVSLPAIIIIVWYAVEKITGKSI